MESAAGTVASSLESQPSQRPGWVWTTVWVFVCFGVSAIVVRLGLAAAAYARLISENASDVTGWPWRVDDAWSLAADIGYGLLFGLVLAWTLRGVVRGRRDGWDVRLWPIACATALAMASETTVAGLTAFALIVVVAREIALRPAAAARRHRGPSAAIAASLLALLIATFSYQPMHPLLAAFPGHRNQLLLSDYDDGFLPPPPSEFQFRLENAGIGTATLRSVRVVGPNARLLDIEGYGLADAGAVIERNSDFDGRARLSKAACATDAARFRIPSASVAALVVRVGTLGMVRTQRFDVKPPVDLFCRSTASSR